MPRVTGHALLQKQMKAHQLLDDGLGLDYKLPESESIRADDLPASHHAGFYTVVVDGELAESVNLADAIAAVAHPVILLSDADAIPLAAKIDSGDDKIYNAAGKFSLNEMADIIRQSKLVVTGHNDFLYFALATNRRIVYLPGSKPVGLRPEKLYARVFQNKKMASFLKL